MNVLYISYDGMTDSLGQSQVIPYIKGLSELGHEFVLLSAEKDANYSKYKNEISDILKKNNIVWNPIKYTKKPPILSTIIDIFKFIDKAKELHKTYKFDIIHCRGYISAFVGMYMKKKYNCKFLFDMRGFFADERVEGGIWYLDKFIYRIIFKYFKKKEKDFFQNADYSICLTKKGKNEINSWDCFNKEIPIEVIPCCADLNHFSSENIKQEDLETAYKELNISNDTFILCYLGSIGTWYMLDEMLDFFNQLNNKRKSVFLFLTKDDPKLIISKCNQKRINTENIIIRPTKRSEVPLYISISDANIFFIKPVYSKTASSPTKMGEIMGMGKAIICNDNVGDVGDIMQDSESGFLVKKFNEQEYLKIIEDIDKLKEFDSNKIRNSAFKYYSLEKGVELYNLVYKKM